MVRRSLSEQTFLILTALASEPLHGYGIVQVASQLSDSQVRLRVATLYGALDRLCADGFVEPDREEIHQGRMRRYYRITESGLSELVRAADRRSRIAQVALERGRRADTVRAAGSEATA